MATKKKKASGGNKGRKRLTMHSPRAGFKASGKRYCGGGKKH